MSATPLNFVEFLSEVLDSELDGGCETAGTVGVYHSPLHFFAGFRRGEQRQLLVVVVLGCPADVLRRLSVVARLEFDADPPPAAPHRRVDLDVVAPVPRHDPDPMNFARSRASCSRTSAMYSA